MTQALYAHMINKRKKKKEEMKTEKKKTKKTKCLKQNPFNGTVSSIDGRYRIRNQVEESHQSH
jgi:hypothetical protein